jgi:hypothetical protein
MENEINVMVNPEKMISSASASALANKPRGRLESDINPLDVARFRNLVEGKAVRRGSLGKYESLVHGATSPHPKSLAIESGTSAFGVHVSESDVDRSDYPGTVDELEDSFLTYVDPNASSMSEKIP